LLQFDDTLVVAGYRDILESIKNMPQLNNPDYWAGD